jgi:phosphonate transport system substrate-binding protein
MVYIIRMFFFAEWNLNNNLGISMPIRTCIFGFSPQKCKNMLRLRNIKVFQKKKMFNYFFLLLLLMASCNNARNAKIIDADIVSSSDEKPSIRDYSSLKAAVSAMLSPRETYTSYEEIFRYISQKTDVPIEFHQRKSYQEINRMLENGHIDFAFICSGAYIELDDQKGVELLTIPVIHGRNSYKAYIITHVDSHINDFNDLQNVSFAFTDPLSNSGYLYVLHRLSTLNQTPENFFRSTLFTHGHDLSIQMVSKGIVDAASVSHLVYEYYKEKEPEKISNTKVVEVSVDFGMPPVVVSSRMKPEMKQKVLEVLTTMHLNDKGKKTLNELLIDSFAKGSDADYNFIRQIHSEIHRR